MTCELYREAISARMDGEEPPVDAADLDAHVAGCAACRAFVARSAALLDQTAASAHGEPTALIAAVLASATPTQPGQAEHVAATSTASPLRDWPRYGLLVVALTQWALATPALLFGSDPGASTHTAHELGSWELALAVGLLAIVVQPQRARGLVPFAAALGAGLLVTTGADVLSGRVGLAGESQHLLTVAGLVMLWCNAHSTPRTGSILPWSPSGAHSR